MCKCFMFVQAALEKANILPSEDAVSTADFTQALTEAFGYAPILHCHNDHRSGYSYIDEVTHCHVRCSLEPKDAIMMHDASAGCCQSSELISH